MWWKILLSKYSFLYPCLKRALAHFIKIVRICMKLHRENLHGKVMKETASKVSISFIKCLKNNQTKIKQTCTLVVYVNLNWLPNGRKEIGLELVIQMGNHKLVSGKWSSMSSTRYGHVILGITAVWPPLLFLCMHDFF